MDRAIDTIVQADRNFADLANRAGISPAFLEYLADDGILFRPGPVNGKQAHQQFPDTTSVLMWEPFCVEISAGADMGYTTGKWMFKRSREEDAPAAYGRYLSIWRKAADGDWKVVLDLGISHPKPAEWTGPRGQIVPPNSITSADVARAKNSLLAQEWSYATRAAEEGPSAALAAFAAGNVKCFREGAYPTNTIEEGSRLINLVDREITWSPSAAFVARSGDLGYTYGSGEITSTIGQKQEKKAFSFVHIWRKGDNDQWQLAIDITNPLPDEE